MKRRLLKIGKWLLILLLVSAVVNGVLTVLTGNRYAAAVEKIRASGDPVSILELAGPTVPRDDNAALVYKDVFDKIDAKSNARAMDVIGCVPVKEETDRIWDPKCKIEPPDGSSAKAFRSPTFWADAQLAVDRLSDLRPSIEAAAAKPACQWTVRWEEGFNALLPHYPHIRAVCRLLAAEAILAARSGRQDEALKKVALMFRIGEQTCDDPILIAVIVKCSICKAANNTLLAVMKYKPLTPDQTAAFNAILEKTDYGREYARSLKSERALTMWGFDCIMSGGLTDLLQAIGADRIPNRFESKALAYLAKPLLYSDGRIALDHISRQIAIGEQPYRTKAQLRLDQSLRKVPWYAVLTRSCMPQFAQVRARIDEARTQTALTQVVIAAQQYRAKIGSYPVSLEELRAKTQWAMPWDPFSGKDFIYRQSGNGFIVYSIGRNLKDDGGTPARDTIRRSSAGIPIEETHKGDIVLHWK